MDGKDRKVHRIATFGCGGQRRIQHPAHARAGAKITTATGGEQRGHGQRGARDEQPERQVVHPREGHVRRADLQRHEVVAETAEQRRDHHEEHHQDAVGGNGHVPDMAVGGTGAAGVGDKTHAFLAHVLHAGVHQLHPHVDGENDRDQADEATGEQVEDADILVVRRHEPADKEPRSGMVVGVNGCVRHGRPPLWSVCLGGVANCRPVSRCIRL